MSAAATPAAMRSQRSANQLTSTRSVMRNHIPAEIALVSAARMLILCATVGAIGRMAKKRPRIMNRGLPGGCGSPITYAAAMYSLASHIAVEGDSVRIYRIITAVAVAAAAM